MQAPDLYRLLSQDTSLELSHVSTGSGANVTASAAETSLLGRIIVL